MNKQDAIFAKDELTVSESGIKIIPASQAKRMPLILASMDEVKLRLNECESTVRQQGYDAGYAQGVADGSTTLLKLLDDAEYYYQSNEKNMLDLIIASIQQVLGDEFAAEELVGHMATKALKELRTPNSVTLSVHPDIQKSVEDNMLTYPDKLMDIRVVADQTLERTDCKVDTQFGSIEASLASQLQAIKNTFYVNSHDDS